MQEIVFRPNYRFRDRVGGPLLLMIGGGSLFIYFVFAPKDTTCINFGIFTLLLGAWGTRNWLKNSYVKIVFGENEIVFYRRILGPETCAYIEISEIVERFILISRRRIDLSGIWNIEELMQIFSDFYKSGKIKPSTIENYWMVQNLEQNGENYESYY